MQANHQVLLAHGWMAGSCEYLTGPKMLKILECDELLNDSQQGLCYLKLRDSCRGRVTVQTF